MSDPIEQVPTIILTLKSVEVSQQINENTFPVGSGPLSVYYYLKNNSFVIQTDNFSFTLSKDHPISAIPPHDGQPYPSYIFPANESSFIVKITDSTSPEAISSFESILNNHSHLTYQEAPEIAYAKTTKYPHLEDPKYPQFDELKYRQIEEPNLENEPMIQLQTKLESHHSEKPSNIVTKGGELTRFGLIWSAEFLAKGIALLGGFIEKKTSKHEEKEVKPSIAEKLATADSATQTAANFTKAQSKVVLGAGKRAGEKIMDSELGHKFEHSKHHDTIVTIGKSSFYALACLYDGLVEAISVLGKGIRDTTAHAVSNRYGEKVGDATKQGFNVIGNIGKIVTVYKDEVNEYIQEQNGMGHVHNVHHEHHKESYETKMKSE